jgi:uncharacterized RDD family membrane protein YckC
MSEEEKPIPKPNIHKPNIPKPNIPKPNIPKPDVKNTTPSAPPVTSVDTDAPAASPAPTPTPSTAAAQPPATTMADAPTDPPETNQSSETQPAEETESPDPKADAIETDLVKRFLGVLIDGIIAAVLGSIVGSVADSGTLHWLVAGAFMLTRDSLPIFDGQSPGKKIMKTKAVKEDGSSLSGDWATGATRNILLAIPLAWLVECFVILTRSGNPGAGKRLGDDWAKTKVVSCE